MGEWRDPAIGIGVTVSISNSLAGSTLDRVRVTYFHYFLCRSG